MCVCMSESVWRAGNPPLRCVQHVQKILSRTISLPHTEELNTVRQAYKLVSSHVLPGSYFLWLVLLHRLATAAADMTQV